MLHAFLSKTGILNSRGARLYQAIKDGNLLEVESILHGFLVPSFDNISPDNRYIFENPFILALPHVEIFKILLDHYDDKILADYRDKALQAAAHNGHANCIPLILNAPGKPISSDRRAEALQAAARNGHAECIPLLLNAPGKRISAKDKGLALLAAAEKGYAKCIPLLLNAPGKRISAGDKGLALQAAARNSHSDDYIPFLLEASKKTISSSHKGLELQAAAEEEGYAKCIPLLLNAPGKRISAEDKGQALHFALQNRLVDWIPLLLNAPGEPISAEDKGKVLHFALHNWQVDWITLLLNAPGEPISAEDKGEVLHFALQNRMVNWITLILNAPGEPISAQDKGKVLHLALQSKRVDWITLILNAPGEPISARDKREVLHFALQNRKVNWITLILNAPGEAISARDKGKVLHFALHNWQVDWIPLLLNAPGEAISAEDKGSALRAAAYRGHIDWITRFLNAPGEPISAEDKGLALRAAALNGHDQCIPLILNAAREAILVEHKGDALVAAAHNGHDKCILLILSAAGEPISAKDRGFALQAAAKKWHVNSISLILNAPGIPISDEDKLLALGPVTKTGDAEAVRLLLHAPGGPIPASDRGNLLYVAASMGYADWIPLILGAPGEPTSTEHKGWALRQAAEKGHLNALNALLADASVEAVAHNDNNAALSAAQLELRGSEPGSDDRARYQGIIARLLLIPAVAQLAHQQQNRQQNLGHIAGFAENSMQALTPGEEELIALLKNHYQAFLQHTTWDAIRANILQYLESEYAKSPAIDGYHRVFMLKQDEPMLAGHPLADTITLSPDGENCIAYWLENGIEHQRTLPLNQVVSQYQLIGKDALLNQESQDALLLDAIMRLYGVPPLASQGNQLPLEYRENFKATELAAYYRHPIHTAWRYLSDRNPWMAPNARYIQTFADGSKAAIISEQDQELLSYFWLALNDVTLGLDCSIIANNKYLFAVSVLADMARGHNNDARNQYAKDTGNWNSDQRIGISTTCADNQRADEPSCVYGVRKRVFQVQYEDHPYLDRPEARPLNPKIMIDYIAEHLINPKGNASGPDNLLDRLNTLELSQLIQIHEVVSDMFFLCLYEEGVRKPFDDKTKTVLTTPEVQVEAFIEASKRRYSSHRIEGIQYPGLQINATGGEFEQTLHQNYIDLIKSCLENPIAAFGHILGDYLEPRIQFLETPKPILPLAELGKKRKEPDDEKDENEEPLKKKHKLR